MPRAAIPTLAVSLLLVAFAYAAALIGVFAAVTPWALALGTSGVLGALLLLAARRARGPMRRLAVVAWIITVVLAAGLCVTLAASPPAAGGPLLLGLPRSTAILLIAVGLVPLVALPLAWAGAFDREVMGDDGT
jgi:hypothetical protein